LWECASCNTVYERSPENFYTTGESERAGRPKDGLMSECKGCHTKRANELRRSSKAAVECSLTNAEWDTICSRWGYECAYCADKPDTIERDHVVPLSNGGDTNKKNIVPACPRCNRSKGSKSISEWYADQPFYDKVREAKIIHMTYGEL
jgi:5-methylcytosine-specific restriction endonuclease McrA